MIETLPRVLISQTRYRGTDLVTLVVLLDVLNTPARNSRANLLICNRRAVHSSSVRYRGSDSGVPSLAAGTKSATRTE
jgi:hypothetical protein